MTDPIADMLTRVRNAITAGKSDTVLPYSKFKHSLAKVMKDNGWIEKVEDFKDDDGHKQLRLIMKYDQTGFPAIRGMKRVSKPGQRIYTGSKNIPQVRFGVGVTIVSTPKGVMTDRQARRQNVGGEVLCQIW